ncbi:MAG TPA: hypothetical protein PLN52_23410 [Opitutaceae bacterium]|nr:hypothetical protein [Opitutaceae bacterium]
MSRAKKPKKPQFDPLAVPDGPREIAAIHADVEAPGRAAESGPSAWAVQPWNGNAALTANDVWGAAIASMAVSAPRAGQYSTTTQSG